MKIRKNLFEKIILLVSQWNPSLQKYYVQNPNFQLIGLVDLYYPECQRYPAIINLQVYLGRFGLPATTVKVGRMAGRFSRFL